MTYRPDSKFNCDRCSATMEHPTASMSVYMDIDEQLFDLCDNCIAVALDLLNSFPSQHDDADDIEWACDDLPYEVLIDA